MPIPTHASCPTKIVRPFTVDQLSSTLAELSAQQTFTEQPDDRMQPPVCKQDVASNNDRSGSSSVSATAAGDDDDVSNASSALLLMRGVLGHEHFQMSCRQQAQDAVAEHSSSVRSSNGDAMSSSSSAAVADRVVKVAVVAPFRQQQPLMRQTTTARPPAVGCADDDLNDCPFYDGQISAEEAKRRLTGAEPGTFLLRDSRSGSHPFALTLRTCGSVTSVRIARCATGYRLDCDDDEASNMPLFADVLSLVKYLASHDAEGGNSGRVRRIGPSSPAAGGCRMLLAGVGTQCDKPLTLARGLPVRRDVISSAVSGS